MGNTGKRYLYFWLSYGIGYIFPFIYFLVKLGVTQHRTTLVIPVILLGLIGIIKLCLTIPQWIKTWKPSFKKGIVKSIPIYLITIFTISIGLLLKYILEKSITFAVTAYFEFTFVLFGSLCVSSIFDALHLKYKELDLMDKGYVLGVVNQ